MKLSWTARGALLLTVALAACTSTGPYVAKKNQDWPAQTPPPASALAYRVFLVGDAGDAVPEPQAPALKLLQSHLDAAGANSAVVFLGDNAYCCGLPDSGMAGRAEAEAHLLAQLQTVNDFPGRVVFLPGNHDWNDGRPGGLEAVARQEAFVEATLDRGNVFLPDDGFPGPVSLKLTDRITLIVLDTQWWLETERKSFGDTGDYELDEAGDFLLELEDLILRNRQKDVLVVGHHPLFSNGRHGGSFSWRSHLTPLPLVGSLIPFYRRFVGKRQDLAHARYASLRRELLKRFAVQHDLIYASGHDHSLQYFYHGGPRIFQHFVVSGAGSRPDFAAPGRAATFTAGVPGFVSLQYYTDNSIWMEAWMPEGDGAAGRLLFRHQLKEAAPNPIDPDAPAADGADYPDYRDSTVVLPVNPDYAGGGALKGFFLGYHHRDAWATPVEIPVLDLGREAGGLTPVKIGGRGQSTSLRMEGADGREYVLRTLDKVAGRTWPDELKATVAVDLAQDQFSMLHPFSAFIVPPLAEAAGVYHAQPRYVIIPDDPRLGRYREQMAGRIVLFEERANNDMSHAESMGRPKDVVGYSAMFRRINNDNDHRVDARSWTRARLFDMLLADWDRHEDQWRWAAFEPYELNPALEGDARKEGKVYRPIPRDRDVAFMRFDGLVPALLKRSFLPLWQDFRTSYGDLEGLNLNGLAQDRRFCAPLTESDWIGLADSLRAALTDEVIEEAVRRWPDPIFALNGQTTIDILKARRDALPEVAARYYRLLARVADVVGSNKHERFEVIRRGDSTRVTVYKTTKKGAIQKTLYRRTFAADETQEIRLYGLGGDDHFDVTGAARRGIRVIAVGGPGEDTFSDASRAPGLRRLTRFYDTETGNTFAPGAETKIIRSGDAGVNDYDPFGFQYNQTLPVVFFGSNDDDGVFLGGGVSVIRHGFRKVPFASKQRIVANFAARTQAFNARYLGYFTGALGGWDLEVDASVLSPNNIRNFYGLGNETENEDDDAEFYQARLSRVRFVPSLVKKIEEGAAIHVAPTFEFTDVRQDENRFVTRPQAGIAEASFDDQWFGGLEAGLTLATTDHPANPRQGVRWESTADVNVGLRNADVTYGTFASSLTAYVSPRISPQLTLAARVGGAHNVGDFPFYAARTLGGQENLRGYRSTRFAGRSSFYQNVDLRAALFDFATYVGFGTAGVLGFFDNGRVWTDGESSRVWHQGYGGGLWVAFFNQVVLTAAYGLSTDDETFTVRLGFLY